MSAICVYCRSEIDSARCGSCGAPRMVAPPRPMEFKARWSSPRGVVHTEIKDYATDGIYIFSSLLGHDLAGFPTDMTCIKSPLISNVLLTADQRVAREWLEDIKRAHEAELCGRATRARA